MHKIIILAFLLIQLSIYSNAQNCTNWLKTPNAGSVHDCVTIGDLDVYGNQLTVEATFSSTDPSSITGYNAALVSKHSMPSDCNFVLRTDVAQLTTQSNGLVTIFSPCDYVANKTYHVAMVYDGNTLKFYRNGFLMVSAPQKGNMVNNDLLTTIANKAGGSTTEGLRGVVNEVRIWNVARTQSQLQTYMNSSLPNPTAQTGLLAYYTFNNLINKQGNAAWNGTLVGSASLNATNPDCTFVVDSCKVPVQTCVNWRDSLRFNVVPIGCNSFNFNGLIYPSLTNINSWQWAFGDGVTASVQNTSHNYSSIGNFTVKLIATSSSGCRDSVFSNISSSIATANAGNDTTVCHGNSFQLHGLANGGLIYAWSPAQYLNDSTMLNPIGNISNDTKFYFSVKNSQGCIATDSVTIKLKNIPLFTINANTSICTNASTQLLASGGNIYQWSPASGLSNPLISNPVAAPSQTITYTVFVRETTCNDTATLNTILSVLSNPVVNANSANDINCLIGQSQLIATGAVRYIWTPSSGLDNPLINNPIASPSITTIYTVVGIDQNGCTDSNSIKVNVSQNVKSGYYLPTAFTPNGDGLNDCFGIKNWGQINKLQFAIYDRYGKKIFYSENPTICWDGTYNGEKQPSGNYIYYIKAITVCGIAERNGSIMLMR